MCTRSAKKGIKNNQEYINLWKMFFKDKNSNVNYQITLGKNVKFAPLPFNS